jgi:hypothetical protein
MQSSASTENEIGENMEGSYCEGARRVIRGLFNLAFIKPKKTGYYAGFI